MKGTWNLAPGGRIVRKIPGNYCPGSYQSIGQVWSLNELQFKRYIQKYILTHVVFTHHDATDLLNHGMVKNTNILQKVHTLEYLENRK